VTEGGREPQCAVAAAAGTTECDALVPSGLAESPGTPERHRQPSPHSRVFARPFRRVNMANVDGSVISLRTTSIRRLPKFGNRKDGLRNDFVELQQGGKFS